MHIFAHLRTVLRSLAAMLGPRESCRFCAVTAEVKHPIFLRASWGSNAGIFCFDALYAEDVPFLQATLDRNELLYVIDRDAEHHRILIMRNALYHSLVSAMAPHSLRLRQLGVEVQYMDTEQMSALWLERRKPLLRAVS